MHAWKRYVYAEMVLLATALLLINLGLWQGSPNTGFVFLPQCVAEGEWWRLLTHPLVHVSGYHLILDSLAFLLLYATLKATHCRQRLGYLAACGVGSLALSWMLSPIVPVSGLCGLSGIAHGLMAITGLEMILEKSTHRIGIWVLATVIIKSVAELYTGTVLFGAQHIGVIGLPVVESHAGGALGGIVAFGVFRLRPKTEETVLSQRLTS